MKVLVIKQPRTKIDLLKDGLITAITLSVNPKTKLKKEMVVYITNERAEKTFLKAKIETIHLLKDTKNITQLQILSTQENKSLLSKQVVKSRNGLSIIYLKDVVSKNDILGNVVVLNDSEMSKYALLETKKRQVKSQQEEYAWFYENVCNTCIRNSNCPYHKYKTICNSKIREKLDIINLCRKYTRQVSSCKECLRDGWCRHFKELRLVVEREKRNGKMGYNKRVL